MDKIERGMHMPATQKFTIAIVITITFLACARSSFSLDMSEYIASEYLEPEKTISMDFKGAALTDVLKIFSQQSGMNFIADADISNKRINLYLDKVPVEEALERILDANKLMYELRTGSNVFVVKERLEAAKALLTRVYQLKHASVPSSKIKKTLSASDISAEDDAQDETANSGIVAAIRAVLTPDGSIVEDTRTNSIIVTDIPSQFSAIEQTIARLDIWIPQILIEAEMLDISKTTADEMGVKWGNTPIQFTGAQKDDLFPFNIDNVIDDNTPTHAPGDASALFEDPRYRVSTTSFAGLSFLMQFLRTKTDTKNLARPRILTLNNETAEIQIKTDEVVSATTTLTASQGQSQSSTEVEREETGIFLKVTPQANVTTREITMAIEPRVILARQSSGFTGADNFKDPEERIAKSVLRIRDGDTIIIGGLLRTDVADVRTNVPFLEKIPLLGAGFRHKDKQETERELIVFITPRITDEEESQEVPMATAEPLVREQDIPSQQRKSANRELSQIEEHR